MGNFINSDDGKKATSFIGVVAAALVAALPPHTIAWKVFAGIAGLIGARGILSSGVQGK